MKVTELRCCLVRAAVRPLLELQNEGSNVHNTFVSQMHFELAVPSSDTRAEPGPTRKGTPSRWTSIKRFGLQHQVRHDARLGRGNIRLAHFPSRCVRLTSNTPFTYFPNHSAAWFQDWQTSGVSASLDVMRMDGAALYPSLINLPFWH